jgi:hypothetical protein
LCLICNESVAVLKDYNIAGHYNSKHREKYETFVSAVRRKEVVAFRRGLESQQNVFRK